MRFHGKFKLEIYRADVHIFFADTPAQWEEDVEKRLHTVYDGSMEGWSAGYIFNPTTRNLILMFKPADELLGNVFHECFHATMNLLDGIGMKHCHQSEEAYTYLGTYIFEQTIKILKKNGAL